MSEELNTGAPKRPTFLTVLCILSFIGIGLGLISGLMSFATAGMMDDMAEMTEQTMEEGMAELEQEWEDAGIEGSGGFLEGLMNQGMAAMEHARTLAIIQILANLLCLFGVLKMWKLKKQGFYLYTVGELVPPIAGIILVGGIMATGLIIPLLFVILYGVNLKHMH